MAEEKYRPPLSEELAYSEIKKFMVRQPKTVLVDTTVRAAMKTMLAHKVSGLPVVDYQGKVLGIYSELDAMLQGASSESLDQKIRYTKPAVVARETDTLKEVLVVIAKKKLKRIPIVDKLGFLAGIVTRRDLMRVLLEDEEKTRTNSTKKSS